MREAHKAKHAKRASLSAWGPGGEAPWTLTCFSIQKQHFQRQINTQVW